MSYLKQKLEVEVNKECEKMDFHFTEKERKLMVYGAIIGVKLMIDHYSSMYALLGNRKTIQENLYSWMDDFGT